VVVSPELRDPAVLQPARLQGHDLEVALAAMGGDPDRGAPVVVGQQGQRLHAEAAFGQLHDLAEELEDRGPALVRAGELTAAGHVPDDVLGRQLLQSGEVGLPKVT
jgi:hypothetical protein